MSRLVHIIGTIFRIWPDRWRQRLDLRDMDDHRLRDIGITRHEAMRESRKPFWRSQGHG